MICHDQPFLTIIIHFQPSWTLFKHYQPSLINRFNHLLTMILDDGWFSWWWMMVDFHDGWWSTIMTSWIYLLSTPLYIIYIYQLSLIKLVFLLVTMIYQPLYISTILYIYISTIYNQLFFVVTSIYHQENDGFEALGVGLWPYPAWASWPRRDLWERSGINQGFWRSIKYIYFTDYILYVFYINICVHI